uniref:Carboxylesterase n=1 Tax=Opuntia streptacantha TaxID=393608 RepID=A0A7C8ZGE1_OPUST
MTQHPTKTTIIAFTISLFVFLLSIQFFLHQNPKMASSSALNQTPIHPDPDPIDPYQRAHIIPNPNGTITRLHEFFPTVPPSLSNSSSLSLSKDVPLNPEKHSWVRIFLPSGSGRPAKLPILIFAHGGGFVLYSAASRVFHEFCSNAASRLGALVISVEYRLAPEHRLPAAYDDVLEALSWVKQGKDEWVKERGNFSNCVLTGQSAGANGPVSLGS